MEEGCVCVVVGYKESNEQNAILRSDTAASDKQGSLSCACERRERRHRVRPPNQEIIIRNPKEVGYSGLRYSLIGVLGSLG